MNGLILHSSPESKDIKFNGKNSKDTESNDAGDLFEKLITSLVKEEKDSKNGNFLLAKLLNLPTEFEKDGKTPSLFSKDEVLDLLKSQSVTSGNKDDKKDGLEPLISLEELFKIALNLKQSDSIDLGSLKIPSDMKNSLELKFESKSIVNELKNAKNIKELLNIAEKNGIKVKNFEFFKEDRAIDPMDKKLVQKITSSDIFKFIVPKNKNHSKIDHNHFAAHHKPSKQNMLAKLINSTNKTVGTTKIEDSKNENQEGLTKNIFTDNHKKVKHTKHKIQTSNDTMDLDPTQQQKTESSKNKIKSDNPKETQELNLSTDEKMMQKNQNKKHASMLSSQNEKTTTYKGELDIRPEVKINEKDSKLDSLDNQTTKDLSQEKTSGTNEVKTDTSIKTKEHHDVKKSLNTFATEFKEKMESYKAPLMKIKMQLTPQNLGDVDVTLINRGSTLHVNITSNANSMALFMQNQAEFKNSLVNMGFSDLQMNFSQNQNSKNQQEKQKNQNGKENNFENIDYEEQTHSIDIAIPNYV